MKTNSLLFLLLGSLMLKAFLLAEVEEVSIAWNGFKCQGMCPSQIEQNLRSIKAVQNLSVNASGFASMKWDSNYPFSYEPFRYASAAVGIHITDMRVRVKGNVVQEGRDLYLISDRDNSRFFLRGPLQTEVGRYAPSNLDTHPLTPGMQDRLLDAMDRDLKVLISGPLLLPSHYNLALIAEQIKVNKAKE